MKDEKKPQNLFVRLIEARTVRIHSIYIWQYSNNSNSWLLNSSPEMFCGRASRQNEGREGNAKDDHNLFNSSESLSVYCYAAPINSTNVVMRRIPKQTYKFSSPPLLDRKYGLPKTTNMPYLPCLSLIKSMVLYYAAYSPPHPTLEKSSKSNKALL